MECEERKYLVTTGPLVTSTSVSHNMEACNHMHEEADAIEC